MQLSSPAPVTGDSEVELLLTLAATLYAAAIPSAKVKISRIGAFSNVLHHANRHPYRTE